MSLLAQAKARGVVFEAPHADRVLVEDNGISREYQCPKCKRFFHAGISANAPVTAFEREETALCLTWCPCLPWTLTAVEIGMHLPQGIVVRIDRETGDIDCRNKFDKLGKPE